MMQEPVVAVPGAPLDWTIIIVAGMGFIQIVTLELLRRTHKAVNSTATKLEHVAEAKSVEIDALKQEVSDLKETRARQTERLAGQGRTIAPPSEPTPVTIVADDPVPVIVKPTPPNEASK